MSGSLRGLAALLAVAHTAWLSAAESPVDHSDKGATHVAAVAEKPWAAAWRGANLRDLRQVAEKPGLRYQLGLPPVWRAEVVREGAELGYLMWEAEGDGHLVDFAVDTDGGCAACQPLVAGVPPLQQFRVDDEHGEAIASGCVPTSAGSVVAFLAGSRYPEWRGAGCANSPAEVARRLRSRLTMKPIRDVDGFTDDGMTLAASGPKQLARAIRADAQQHGVAVAVAARAFLFERYRCEIKKGRPTIVMGNARLPHKPHLSWGHSVAGVGATEIAGVRYVGFLDNWYPSKHATTVRWLEAAAFHHAVLIRPGCGKSHRQEGQLAKDRSQPGPTG